MRQYYTLVQPFTSEGELALGEYLEQSGITAHIGAEIASELTEYGFDKNRGSGMHMLLKKYVVLLEEHELTAIKLTIDNIQVLENRPAVNLQNKVRGYFKWFLK
jgi:hypothetical protein